MKAGPDNDLYNRFEDRIIKSGRALHLTPFKLLELPESRLADAEARKAEEAELLFGRIETNSRIILLDERGKDQTSEEFASEIKQERDSGTPSLSFVIGGPDGHGEKLKTAAHQKIRFGSMTWPHQIVRILLAEQLYRAMTILSGHPYHRK